jgi:recombinase, phage RecT family
MTISNAVAQQQAARPSIAQAIELMKPEIARALPKHLDADRMARLALTLVRKDRALASCSPESFAGSLLTAAALGLEPGVNGEAYLVAYKGECTLIVGYQGYAKLFYQSPLAKHLDAQAVHENDEFDYEYGLNPRLVHKPAKGERGKVTHYYAVATLNTGASAFTVLTESEVKALRANSRPQKIADPQHWMERKTALRQLIKLLPKSSALDAASRADERAGTELQAERIQEHEDRLAIESGADPVTGEWMEQEQGPDA